MWNKTLFKIEKEKKGKNIKWKNKIYNRFRRIKEIRMREKKIKENEEREEGRAEDHTWRSCWSNGKMLKLPTPEWVAADNPLTLS